MKLEELSKEQLIEEIKKLKERKKYGLVWEEKDEVVATECRNKLPVLEEFKESEIQKGGDCPYNILIEGDNYHSLSVLSYTHSGSIDVIYIDPPYNRGGDFMYNDQYVDKEDTFRHSKWLSFMSKRLRIAKTLLTDKGVLYVSIDDAEFAQLKMLLDEIFGEKNVDVMIWRKSGYGRDGKMKNTTTFRKDHEYILVCFNKDRRLNKLKEVPDFQNEYGNQDGDPRGSFKAGSISRREDASNPQHANYYTVVSPSGKTFTRQFDIPEDKFKELNSDLLINDKGEKVSRIYWGKKGDAVPAIKIFLNEERAVTPYSVLLTKGTTTEGTKEVSAILSIDAKKMRPKPSSLIQTLIQLADKKDNLVVLDFFAGTGTTGHAVLKMNALDEGKRTFILCTNNENNILDSYCYPRIKNVIEGYSDVKGIDANLKYFKTTFIPKSIVSDDTRTEIVKKSTEMICVKEGTFEEVFVSDDYKIFKDANHTTAILFNLDYLEEMRGKIETLKLSSSIYVFSLNNDTYDKDFEDLSIEYELCPIPESILEVYRKLFKE